jgi:flavocytochrome c
MNNWDEQWDVVIIGSGLAGLSAAIEANAAGASVVVLEKMKVTGGNTRISDGGVAAPNNDLQKAQGIEDAPELFYQDMIGAGLGLNHPPLVRVVAAQANEAVVWSRDTLGVKYLDRLDRFGGHSVARCLTTHNHTGADFIRAQSRWLEQKGVEIRTRCRLTRLLTDYRGDVRGVKIRSGYKFGDDCSGVVQHIHANRAVILATGGFGNDIPFRMIQNPGLDASLGTTNHRGATAEGLIAALAVNAAPVHLSWIQLGPWGCADESGYGRGASFASYSVYPGGILVDPATGGRIVNEWADRRRRCDAIFQTGHTCVGIVDASGADVAAESLRQCLRRGYVKAFDSWAELASAYAMPVGRLEATVREYNQAIGEGGPDPFGKPLTRGAKPLVQPPFYAIRLWPKVHYTPGGVGINETAQVIDCHQRPIPRLFAAGEVCGGIHGASRLGSCALTECMVFGRVAGKEAAALPPRDPE